MGPSRIAFVAWARPEDLLSVKAQLFDSDGGHGPSRDSALRTITIWSQRAPIPKAIEHTAKLVAAQLSHEKLVDHTGPHVFMQYDNICYSFAYTFSRFVTDFCDPIHPKTTMYDLARQHGIPFHWVKARHDIVHNTLPSLAELVPLVDEAIGWLYEHTWSQLGVEEVDPPLTDDDKVDAELVQFRSTELQTQYLKLRKDQLRNKVNLKDNNLGRTFALQFQEEHGRGTLESSISRFEIFVQCLVQSELMFPKTLDVSHVKNAFLIWDPLLQWLTAEREHHKFAPFLSALLGALSKETRVKGSAQEDKLKSCLFAWINHIISSDTWRFVIGVENLRLVHLPQIAESCVLNSNHWTNRLLASTLQQYADDRGDEIDTIMSELVNPAALLDGDVEAGDGTITDVHTILKQFREQDQQDSREHLTSQRNLQSQATDAEEACQSKRRRWRSSRQVTFEHSRPIGTPLIYD